MGDRWAVARGVGTAAALALWAAVAWAAPGHSAAPAALAQGEVDPAPLRRLFERHVRGGAVDYQALRGDAVARAGLDAFLDACASMPEQAPLASWLNAYNASVIEAVLAHYPIDSVQSVPGFFEKKGRVIAGEARSLDEIEHGVVRPRFRDARVHMALNCAAVSCPPLPPRPLRQAGLDAELDRLAGVALSDPRVARLEDGVLHHSKLFEWFREDFVREAGSVRAWIARHAVDPRLRSLPEDTKLRAMPYDWALAEAK